MKIIGFSHEDGVLHPVVTTVLRSLQELMVGDISNGEDVSQFTADLLGAILKDFWGARGSNS